MEVIVKDGQTFADIAVQEYGSFEAALQLAKDAGASISDVPAVGRSLQLHQKVYNRVMQHHCKTNGVMPATERDFSGQRLRIFTDEFNETFK